MSSGALAALIHRIAVIEAAVGDRFPLFADPAGGWTTTRRGSWTGGFWAGLLWLRAAVTGGGRDLEAARSWSRRLLPRAGDDTDTRAMTFWYGAGTGHRWTGDPGAAEVAMSGARALAASALPGSGMIPAGTAFGGDPRRIAIDAFAAVVALLDDAGMPQAAAAHARGVAATLVGADATISAGPGPVWARGQAWGLLGFAVAADRLGGEFATVAARVADRWLALAGTGVPPAMFGLPESPVDTSAAVIAAAGLWTLGDTAAAQRIVDRVVTDHLDADGTLTGGCYDLAGGVACAHELIWGTYFLAALLAVSQARVPAAGW
ncbi:hypothetical protein AB0M36_07930 [Actinoplanes sp. NPDC051346]|uniref:hypothetical protein n=1 Tax=Actinoplanes sp. NPDC051346 TaxID=3155048 RepID=UPI003436C6F7